MNQKNFDDGATSMLNCRMGENVVSLRMGYVWDIQERKVISNLFCEGKRGLKSDFQLQCQYFM